MPDGKESWWAKDTRLFFPSDFSLQPVIKLLLTLVWCPFAKPIAVGSISVKEIKVIVWEHLCLWHFLNGKQTQFSLHIPRVDLKYIEDVAPLWTWNEWEGNLQIRQAMVGREWAHGVYSQCVICASVTSLRKSACSHPPLLHCKYPFLRTERGAMNYAFYITREMTTSEKLRLLCWGSVWVQISGWLREVPNSTTWYTACAAGCTAQKQLYSALHPKYFWDEKTILWLPYSLLFLVYICHALCVGSARTPRERVLCWPLQPGASAGRQQDPSGTGTVTRNVKIAACAERLWLRTHFAITFKVSVGLTLAVL